MKPSNAVQQPLWTDAIAASLTLRDMGRHGESSFILREVAQAVGGRAVRQRFHELRPGEAGQRVGRTMARLHHDAHGRGDEDLARLIEVTDLGLSPLEDLWGDPSRSARPRSGTMKFRSLESPIRRHDLRVPAQTLFQLALTTRDVRPRESAVYAWAALASAEPGRWRYRFAFEADYSRTLLLGRIRAVADLFETYPATRRPDTKELAPVGALARKYASSNEYRVANRVALMTLGLADPKAAAQSVTRLEDAFRQLRYGEAVKTASEGLYLCQRLLKADQPAIAAEAYDLSLACHPLQGTFQQTIAWEFFEHELDQLLTGVEEENTPPAYHPGEEVEEISPETPKGETVDFVRASLEAVGGKTNLLVSATANWNVVDDSETPPGHDVLVSAFSPGLDIYPIWQPSNLPAVGTMETVVFSVVPTAEGPWTVSVTFHDAKDFRRMEQVYVHISADRVSVPS